MDTKKRLCLADAIHSMPVGTVVIGERCALGSVAKIVSKPLRFTPLCYAEDFCKPCGTLLAVCVSYDHGCRWYFGWYLPDGICLDDNLKF